MPRIFTSANDPYDFCLKCFPGEAKAISLYGNAGEGPDGRGNCFEHNAEHPNYDYENYHCTKCRKLLTERDNYSC